jgi:electron transfer flavoprotein alpha subunit
MLAVGARRTGARAEILRLDPPAQSRVRVRSRVASAATAPGLDDADVVIGVGKGVGGPAGLASIGALARVLEAPICTTRDVTDAGWLPKQLQVGLTGRAIAPRLYVAIGVRGAFEHTVGIRRAGLVVAINRSAKAPIFKVADYGIAADYADVVPLLAERLLEVKRERTGARADVSLSH